MRDKICMFLKKKEKKLKLIFSCPDLTWLFVLSVKTSIANVHNTVSVI